MATPAQDRVHYEFARSLALATAEYLAADVGELALLHDRGALLVQQRNRLVAQALERDATHICFVDSDSEFPADSFVRLLSHGLPVVAVNFSTRRPPFRGVAMYEREARQVGEVTRLKRVTISPSVGGLHPAALVGMGMTLLDLEVFRRIEEPWFDLHWDPHTGAHYSEDAVLCRKLHAAGIPISVDLELSQRCRHIGVKAYTLQEAWEAEQERAPNPVAAGTA